MQQIINFLIKNSYKLLFLLLLGVSLTLTVKSHSYHRSQYINSSNAVSGYTYNQISSVKDYFGLRQKNDDLARENARLKEILFNKKDTVLESKIVVPNILSDFVVRRAKVIKNSYKKQENFLTLDRGAFEGLKTDMAVISDSCAPPSCPCASRERSGSRPPGPRGRARRSASPRARSASPTSRGRWC